MDVQVIGEKNSELLLEHPTAHECFFFSQLLEHPSILVLSLSFLFFFNYLKFFRLKNHVLS